MSEINLYPGDGMGGDVKIEEEKWNQEAFNLGEKYYLNLISLAAFKDGYLQACKVRQKEIERLTEVRNYYLNLLSLELS